MLFGLIIAWKIKGMELNDLEAQVIAALLHDLGLPLGDHSGCDCVSPNKRFEVDGADAARAFLSRSWPDKWNQHRLQLVWDAIALHAVGSIALYKENVVKACCMGIRADFLGPDCMPGDLLSWTEYAACVQAYPRFDLLPDFKTNMLALCIRKPSTTYDNTASEWGSKYLELQEYDRAAHSIQDMIEQSMIKLSREKFDIL